MINSETLRLRLVSKQMKERKRSGKGKRKGEKRRKRNKFFFVVWY